MVERTGRDDEHAAEHHEGQAEHEDERLQQQRAAGRAAQPGAPAVLPSAARPSAACLLRDEALVRHGAPAASRPRGSPRLGVHLGSLRPPRSRGPDRRAARVPVALLLRDQEGCHRRRARVDPQVGDDVDGGSSTSKAPTGARRPVASCAHRTYVVPRRSAPGRRPRPTTSRACTHRDRDDAAVLALQRHVAAVGARQVAHGERPAGRRTAAASSRSRAARGSTAQDRAPGRPRQRRRPTRGAEPARRARRAARRRRVTTGSTRRRTRCGRGGRRGRRRTRRPPTTGSRRAALPGCPRAPTAAARPGRRRRPAASSVGLVLGDVALAAAQVARCGTEDLLLLRLQCRQRVADGELLEDDVVVRAVHGVPLGSGAGAQPPGGSRPLAALDRPSSDSFMRCIPASIRVFTVPSGVAVRPAISRWV